MADLLTSMRRRQCLNLIREGNRKINEVRIGKNEGESHAVVKESICEYLRSKGKHFVTEAIFKKGGRADIICLDDMEIIEVADSENEKSLTRKKRFYPTGMNITVVRIS